MIREIRKNNETLQIGTLQDRQVMESTAPLQSYETAVDYLRRFMTDAYNMTVLRKVLYENSSSSDIHMLDDQGVISEIAKKISRRQLCIARKKTAPSAAGSSSPSVKEVAQVEGKKWSKKEYVKSFLEESKSTPVPVLGVASFSEENKSTPAPPEPESDLHWIEVCVVDDNDKPISGKPARLHATDGQVVEEVLGPDGLVRADEIPEGVCKFVLPVKDRAEWIDPNESPPPEDPKELPEGHWIVRKHIKPPGPEVPNLRTDEKHKVIIGRKIVEQLEIDEALFRLMSAVLLPEAQEPDTAPTEPDGTRPTAMDLLAASLRYAELHPERKILVTGHTDTSGGDEYNQDLSEFRAGVVYAVLANDETSRKEFGRLCHGPHLQGKEKKQQVLYNDRVQVLNWVVATFGWPCSTDGEYGSYLKAVKAFQNTYNTEGNEKKPKEQLAVDGDFGPACWRAVFDCYQVHLAETLECTTEELQVLQDRVRPRFLKQYVGCGENKPKEMVGVDNYRSQTNRRVEVLFFEPPDHVPETPCLVGDCEPEGCELYDRMWYLRKRLRVEIKTDTQRLARIRLLNMYLDPAGRTKCHVTVGERELEVLTRNDGIAEFEVSPNDHLCHVKWAHDISDTESEIYERKNVRLNVETDEERLENLGYLQEKLEERVNAFQLEFERDVTGNLDDINDELRQWHDDGQKPQLSMDRSNFLGSAGPTSSGSVTAAPQPIVDKIAGSPGKPNYIRGTKRIYRIDLLPGTHAAVTFHNIEAVQTTSNNLNVVPSNDSLTWVESSSTATTRNLFFWTKRYASVVDTTLFQQRTGPGAVRTVLQVKTYPFPTNGPAILQLYGRVMSLNAAGGGIRPYNNTDVHPVIPHTESHQAVLDRVVQEDNRNSLTHLIINAHGDLSNARHANIQIGDHFHRGNLYVWDRLQGRVNYIWFQNCVVGNDHHMMSEIARRTGAWVSAPFLSIPIVTVRGYNHLDYSNRVYKHFNTNIPVTEEDNADPTNDFKTDHEILAEPRSRDLFFQRARHSTQGKFEDGLYFNLIGPYR